MRNFFKAAWNSIELKNGTVSEFEIEPGDAGVAQHCVEDLKGGDAVYNATALKGVLNGDKNAYRDMVLMNAGAGMLVGGLASDLKDGAKIAAESIDSGKAKQALSDLVTVSNGGVL